MIRNRAECASLDSVNCVCRIRIHKGRLVMLTAAVIARRSGIASPERIANPTNCHCEMCRGTTGAPCVAWFSVPAAEFELLSGTPTRFRSSSHATRTFCPPAAPSSPSSTTPPRRTDITTCSLDEPDRSRRRTTPSPASKLAMAEAGRRPAAISLAPLGRLTGRARRWRKCHSVAARLLPGQSLPVDLTGLFWRRFEAMMSRPAHPAIGCSDRRCAARAHRFCCARWTKTVAVCNLFLVRTILNKTRARG